jgi:hypothetical protein
MEVCQTTIEEWIIRKEVHPVVATVLQVVAVVQIVAKVIIVQVVRVVVIV